MSTRIPDSPSFRISEREEAREMTDSGLISIQSHTYDLHQAAAYETGTVRENMAPLPGEDEWDYADMLADDTEKKGS